MKKVLVFCVFCLMTGTMFAQYVDLGLPSGTLWKNQNEEGYFVAQRAKTLFGGELPSEAQFRELIYNCVWIRQNNGFLIEGPNGNTIFLPAAGVRNCEGVMKEENIKGYYWTQRIGDYQSTYWTFVPADGVGSNYSGSNSNCYGLSIRLVKTKLK